jgi:hypothetical protein
MVAYVSGPVKATKRAGQINTLRRCTDATKQTPLKKTPKSRANLPFRLNEKEQAELDRAARKGFLVVSGSKANNNPLITRHRQWCDTRGKPHVMVCKATRGSNPVDQVFVDMSPLRLGKSKTSMEASLGKRRIELLLAAEKYDMVLAKKVACDDEECKNDFGETTDEIVINANEQVAWATKAIENLPEVSIGIFKGSRSNAKSMAKELALLWDIPNKLKDTFPVSAYPTKISGGRKKLDIADKMNGLGQHRKRGGGHRQAW